MADAWLTAEQVSAATGWTKRHVHRTARKKNWMQRRGENAGRNGKARLEYALSSLPAEAQIRATQATGEIVVTPDAILQKQPSLFASAEAAERVDLDERDLAEANRRMEIIAPMVDFSRGHRLQIDTGDTQIANLNELAGWIAAQRGISASSLWRWFSMWKKSGHYALARKVRKDRGACRSLPLEAQAFIQKKYCIEHLNANHVYDVLARDWKREKLGSGEPPSYATVRRHLASLPMAAKVYCREGKEAFTAKCAPFVLRKAPPAMQWWISDHRTLDVFCSNTLFSHLGRHQLYRPTLTAVYDWGSRMMVGFAIAPTPSSATIGSALRMAAREFGFPGNIYWDNGKDYQKVKRELEEIQRGPQIEDLLRTKQVKVTSALPFHPRSKPVEAYFVLLSRRFDAMWGPAYAGNRPQNRRPECREAQKHHAEFLKGTRRESPLPTDEKLFAALREFIWEYNFEMRLDALDGHTPESVMNEQYPLEKRTAAAETDLARLLSVRCERMVRAGGCVEIDRMDYEPDEMSLGALALRQGDRLLILRDPYNLADAIALDERGFYVGRLQLKGLIEQAPDSPVTQDDIKAGMKRQRVILRACREYSDLLKRTAAAQDWKWEHELLLERARERTGTDDFEAAKMAAPGARRGFLREPRAARQLQPAFVSDAVAEDAGFFNDLKAED